ncbi:MAG: ATP-binding cassette domain-containing protein [Candidatus Hermodarchaeota archaeon]|nr:ATP-binding cassette domain-containing protein [Candidatus Hermodarchaeota archaeon]
MSSPSQTTLRGRPPALEINNLEYTYEGSKKAALTDIQLKIQPGEFIVIAGPSGSGKSTFARSVAGFIPHEYNGTFQGSVKINDQDTRTLSVRDIARNVSLIQQDPDSQLVTLKVLNEVAFGPENFQVPPDEIRTQLEWALNTITASNLRSRSTHSLSGGEKQKVVISSFLAIRAPILIFDEPTARLDPPTTLGVVNTLHQLNRSGITILVVEHRIQPFLTVASRIILLNEGQIHFDGTPDQLQKTPQTLTGLGVVLHPSVLTQPEPQSMSVAPKSTLLDVFNLTYSYPRVEEFAPSLPALKDVTFSVQPGEIIAIMGANGSGKSTLLLHLMGLLHPDTGFIQLNGENLLKQPVSKLAQKVGIIFQNPLHQLFTQTVWEEVLLASEHLKIPEPNVARDRAEELLEVLGLSNYRDQSPFSLSLGEQRRLTIASILLHHPQLLLLDEPFIGQDYRNVHQIMRLQQQAAENGAAILLATHDASIVKSYCHRLLFLYAGQLLIDAPVQQGLDYMKNLGDSAYRLELNKLEVEQVG